LTKVDFGTDNLSVKYEYDDAGRNIRMVYPNGIQRDNSFNDRSLITQIKYTKSTSTLLKFDYEYDKIGNITRKKITWKSGKITDWHYQYDNLNRLKRVTLSQNSRVTKTYYTYDKVGNRLTKESMAYNSGSSSGDSMTGLSDKIVYEYNADNELLNADDVDFEFDLNGNMVSKNDPDEGETQYVYNKMGRLVKIIDTDDRQTKYYYRHDGLRYRKVEKDNDQILYFWGAGVIPPLLSERKIKSGEAGSGSGTGKKLASYPPGMNCIRVYNYSTGKGYNYYYLTDHLGSVYYLTDEKANIVNTYNYDEFGNVLSKSQKIYNPMGFTGEQQHAEEDGLIYLRNRYYIPELGRFSQKDPLMNINQYTYVSNKPANYIDPLGLKLNDGEVMESVSPSSELSANNYIRWLDSLAPEERQKAINSNYIPSDIFWSDMYNGALDELKGFYNKISGWNSEFESCHNKCMSFMSPFWVNTIGGACTPVAGIVESLASKGAAVAGVGTGATALSTGLFVLASIGAVFGGWSGGSIIGCAADCLGDVHCWDNIV